MRKNSIKLFLKYKLMLLLALFSNSINSFAYDFEVDGFYYNIIASDQVEVTYKKFYSNFYESDYSGDLQIPSSITYDGINYSVTRIGASAFTNCDGLTSIAIPNSVTSIDGRAFWYCSLTSITIPSSVISIGNYAFAGCMFLTSINIPSSVTSIGTGVFSVCSGVTSINVETGNSAYDSRDNCNAIIETSSNTLIAGCMNTIIPSSVTSIGDRAFYGCITLTSITIPNSVTSFGDSAFDSCTGLTSINISNSVTTIGVSAFYRCSSLTSITIPNSVTSIGIGAFAGCSVLASIKVESGNVAYDSRDNCNAIIETSSNTLIAGCVNTIIPNSVTSIGQYAFHEIRLTSITIPNSVRSIGSWAFHSCRSLTSISIPNGVTSIDVAAFYGCERLTSITIPNSVTEIRQSAFYNCSADVICYATNVPNTASDAFRAYSIQNAHLYVPASSINSYKAQAPWNYFKSITAIEGSKTYNLSITATGNGTASYDGTTIKGTTKSFTVNEGTTATITFTPDAGYRIKSLKVNGSAKTATISYDVTVNADTSVEVEFEEIPIDPDIPKTYTLSIRAKGNGIATYNGETIRATTKTYTLEEGTKVSMTFTPDEGNQIKSLRVNEEYQTVTDKYEGTINADTSIKIDFEEIPNPDDPDDPDNPEPPVTYTLTIKAVGNGTATYGEEVIRDKSSTFTLDEGTTGSITFTPDEGYHIKSLSINGSEISIASSYDFTMNSDTSVEVEFEVTIVDRDITIDGLNYEVISFDEHSLFLREGDYGLTLVIPDKVTYQNEEWNITGIKENALDGCEDLAAIIWNPEIPFTARVTNPNLLLYVKNEQYAPAAIKNVVVNGFAKAITLTDAPSGNNFYCPEAFVAQSIVYTHNYSMKTGLNESRGWETIALPFDVQMISHSSKGEISPFALWNSGSSNKPFWLYELTGNGFGEADAIKANTPYIISMPNNENYPNDYLLAGRVTFSALNAQVKKSDEIQTASYSSNTFIPTFTNLGSESGYYALNVNNEQESYQGSGNEGSKFILNLRKIHPFEAYMTSTSGTRSIDIFDGMTTGIRGIEEIVASEKTIKVYDLSGRLIKTGVSMEAIRQELPAGVYIVNNRKMIIK